MDNFLHRDFQRFQYCLSDGLKYSGPQVSPREIWLMIWIAPSQKDTATETLKKRLRRINRFFLSVGIGWGLFVGNIIAGDHTTLSINTLPDNGPVVVTNSLSIGSNQVVELVALPQGISGSCVFDVEKRGITYTFDVNGMTVAEGAGYNSWREITPVAGPVIMRLRFVTNYAASANFYCTLRVTPEAFNPEKTVMVTPGGGGANVSLESSSNLADWTTATNGFYVGLSNALFFRINLNRSGFVPPVPPDGSPRRRWPTYVAAG